MDKVILVMNRPGNVQVLRDALSEMNISGIGVSQQEELHSALDDSGKAMGALVDITGFGNRVWEICAALQARDIPFIVLSTPQELEAGTRSLAYGAISVLQKPVARQALMQLVRSMSV